MRRTLICWPKSAHRCYITTLSAISYIIKTNKKRQHSSKTSTPGSDKVVKKQLKPDAFIMAAHTTKSMAELTLRKRAYKTLELEDKEVGTFQFFNSQSVFGPDMLQSSPRGHSLLMRRRCPWGWKV